MRRVTLSLVLLAVGALPALAQDWTPIDPLPQARYGAAGAALGESFFVLGGFSGGNLSSAVVWTETSGWTGISPMSITRQFPGAAACGGFVYAIGGTGSTGMPETSVERFNPAGNSWSNVAPLPMGRSLMGVAEFNGFIYVLGGEGMFGELDGASFRYDPSSNSWAGVAPIPVPCSGPGAAVMGSQIYVVGGSSISALTAVQIYNPASDSWSAGPDLPEPLWMPAVESFEGRIWVMGGFDQYFGRSDRVYSLASGGVWQTETALPAGLASSAVGSNGSRIVLAGGMNSSGQPVNSAVTRVGQAPPPPPPPPAGDLVVQAEFNPHTLNVSSNGRWVSVKLWAEEWSVENLNPASVSVGGVMADQSVEPSMGERDGMPCMSLKFPREAFANLGDGDHVLIVSGETMEGALVEGEAHVRVTGTNPKKDIAQNQGPNLKPVGGNGISGVGRVGSALSLSLNEPAHVRIDVVDVQGRVVDQLANEPFGPGEHRIEWTGARQMSPGMYFVRAQVGGTLLTSRIAVVH